MGEEGALQREVDHSSTASTDVVAMGKGWMRRSQASCKHLRPSAAKMEVVTLVSKARGDSDAQGCADDWDLLVCRESVQPWPSDRPDWL